jgi:hypothetical protein
MSRRGLGLLFQVRVKLSKLMLNCGCFWIYEVTAKVGKCPGMDLGSYGMVISIALMSTLVQRCLIVGVSGLLR